MSIYSAIVKLKRPFALAMPCVELLQMSKSGLRAFFDSFDCVMTDCDGVLWRGNSPLEGAPDVVRKLREDLGKRIFYCTNNSTKTRKEYAVKCGSLGFGGHIDEMVGTSYLAAQYLKNIGYDGKVYVIGTTGVTQELDEVGIQHTGVGPDVVAENWGYDKADDIAASLDPDLRCVVCGFDSHLSYFKLAKAATILAKPGTIFIGTNTDEQFPCGNGVILPGTGAMVSAVATASGREPIVMGKPSKMMFEVVKQSCPDIQPGRTLMIGDRANTDILLGKNCGLQTLMVGTGVHSLDDVRKWEKSPDAEERRLCADFFVPKLGDLLPLIEEAFKDD